MTLKFYKYFIIPVISKSSKSFARRIIITSRILLIEEEGLWEIKQLPELTK